MAVLGSQLYSFRYTTGVFSTVFQPDTPAAAALAAIEAKLTEGHRTSWPASTSPRCPGSALLRATRQRHRGRLC
jgi:hypothetical protein